MPEKITLKQAAALLGIDRNRMGWLLREGHIKAEKIGGYMWVVGKAEILAARDRWDREGYPWRKP